MAVIGKKNRIANRNTGGNKKQGLVPSTGKSMFVRSTQRVKAALNDKTVYCVNQYGGIGTNRSQTRNGDSSQCVKRVNATTNAISANKYSTLMTIVASKTQSETQYTYSLNNPSNLGVDVFFPQKDALIEFVVDNDNEIQIAISTELSKEYLEEAGYKTVIDGDDIGNLQLTGKTIIVPTLRKMIKNGEEYEYVF